MGFTIELVDISSNNVTVVQTENTTVNIEGVVPFTRYYARVAAFTMVGTGPYTEGISFLTLEDGENTNS